MTEIRGRAALVTGGGSGIGKGLAIELARQGAAGGRGGYSFGKRAQGGR